MESAENVVLGFMIKLARPFVAPERIALRRLAHALMSSASFYPSAAALKEMVVGTGWNRFAAKYEIQ